MSQDNLGYEQGQYRKKEVGGGSENVLPKKKRGEGCVWKCPSEKERGDAIASTST